MKTITIIVPVFNAKNYLNACIESILFQKDVTLELLLVDNNSKDGSTEICEQYAQEHSNIQVLHAPRRGVSHARNMGIDHASGDYLAFVDADDCLADSRALHDLVSALEDSCADIAVGNYKRLWHGVQLPARSLDTLSPAERECGDFRFQGFFSVGTLSYVWSKLYRTDFLRKNHIRFGDYDYAEDKLFNFEVYMHGAAYTFLDRSVYIYRNNEMSISHTYRRDSSQSWMQLSQELDSKLTSCGREKQYGDLVAYTIFFAVFFDAKMKYIHDGQTIRTVMDTLRNYRSYPLAKRSFGKFAGRSSLREVRSILWKLLIKGFSVAMYLKLYFLLGLGIKLLIDYRIDEKLSDTGLREERTHHET